MNNLDDIILKDLLQVDHTGHIVNLENDEVEYKVQLEWGNPTAQNKYIKELIALSNAGGGYLIFGINDKTGEIIGLNEIKSVDLKNVTDQIQKYFVPSIDIGGRTYKHLEVDLFVVYAKEYKDIPAVCIRDGNELKNGSLYWRYSGKSEPIKGADFHLLLSKLKNGSIAQLVEVTKETRKKDKLPKFQWDGGSSRREHLSWEFKNIGENAETIAVIADKNSESTISNAPFHIQFIGNGERWNVTGPLYGELPFSNRKFIFRLYFQDIYNNLYYQEFQGSETVAKPNYVTPVETTNSEMEEYKKLNS
ncbi:MAG TPA: hypothetical protein DDX39_08205 [Bacteroidales bacterium]|nr:MAG: hypothetical protein A2W98_14745 [Bacteroidetes bacterium GWF2_33_38]HBF88608.1 hypothetical protein [Bacteroidales bacterium]